MEVQKSGIDLFIEQQKAELDMRVAQQKAALDAQKLATQAEANRIAAQNANSRRTSAAKQ